MRDEGVKVMMTGADDIDTLMYTAQAGMYEKPISARDSIALIWRAEPLGAQLFCQRAGVYWRSARRRVWPARGRPDAILLMSAYYLQEGVAYVKTATLKMKEARLWYVKKK